MCKSILKTTRLTNGALDDGDGVNGLDFTGSSWRSRRILPETPKDSLQQQQQGKFLSHL